MKMRRSRDFISFLSLNTYRYKISLRSVRERYRRHASCAVVATNHPATNRQNEQNVRRGKYSEYFGAPEFFGGVGCVHSGSLK